MSEQSTESTEAAGQEATEQTPDTGDATVVEIKALADELGITPGQLKGRLEASRKWEERAKENADKAKGYDELKRSQMTEQEKAVEQARADARADLLRETAPRLVSAEFRAAAAGRMSPEQVAELIEDLDMTKYLTENGEVDTERVAKKVNALAPAEQHQTATFPDLGQGVRETAHALNGDPLLNDLKTKLGIS